MHHAFTRAAAAVLVAFAALAAPVAQAGPALDRIVERKSIRLGVRTDAPPFSFVADGRPQGFTVDLCALMAGAIFTTSNLREITGTFVTVGTGDGLDRLASGEIDVLCGATTATLTRRETLSFTIPIFGTGIGALLRADAPAAVREALAEGGAGAAATPDEIRGALSGRRLGVRSGTTAAEWLRAGPGGGATVVPVDDHAVGIRQVADGTLDAYFADRAILMGQLRALGMGEGMLLSRATYTYEPYALAIPRGDEDLRLVLDRALSHLYRTGAILQVYERHFGPPTPEAVLFYAMAALPE